MGGIAKGGSESSRRKRCGKERRERGDIPYILIRTDCTYHELASSPYLPAILPSRREQLSHVNYASAASSNNSVRNTLQHRLIFKLKLRVYVLKRREVGRRQERQGESCLDRASSPSRYPCGCTSVVTWLPNILPLLLLSLYPVHVFASKQSVWTCFTPWSDLIHRENRLPGGEESLPEVRKQFLGTGNFTIVGGIRLVLLQSALRHVTSPDKKFFARVGHHRTPFLSPSPSPSPLPLPLPPTYQPVAPPPTKGVERQGVGRVGSLSMPQS